MTIVGGVLLVFSFVLPRVGINSPVDPAWGTVVISGIPLLYLAVWRIIYNPGISKISSALLITIAMFAAIAFGDLFAAGEVAFIMAIGALLEDATTNRAKKGLKKLISLAPTQGRRIRNGKEEMISAEKIMKGDMLRILPGETVPVDGVIVSGETSVDQSIIKATTIPRSKWSIFLYFKNVCRYGSAEVIPFDTKVCSSCRFAIVCRISSACCSNFAFMRWYSSRVRSPLFQSIYRLSQRFVIL